VKNNFTKAELVSFLTKTITVAKEQQNSASDVKSEIRWSGYVRALCHIQQVIKHAEESLDEYDLKFSATKIKEPDAKP